MKKQPIPCSFTPSLHAPFFLLHFGLCSFLAIISPSTTASAQDQSSRRGTVRTETNVVVPVALPGTLTPADLRTTAGSVSFIARTATLAVGDASAARTQEQLREGPIDAEKLRLIESVRAEGREFLRREENAMSAPAVLSRAAEASLLPPRTPVEPLRALSATNSIECERRARIDELRRAVDGEPEPGARDRLQLTLAGHLIGQNDWHAARSIYGLLAASSADPAVQEAVRRNLLVVDKKIEALAERDTVKRQRLELELARIHQRLGHERAMKRITRELKESAHEGSVREEAARLLHSQSAPAEPPSPTLPPAASRRNGGGQ
jgi:hypothetical protein